MANRVDDIWKKEERSPEAGVSSNGGPSGAEVWRMVEKKSLEEEGAS